MPIRRVDFRFRRWSFFLTVVFLLHQAALGQASYTAQIRGVVTDQTGAVVSNATVTITNDATNISVTAHSNDNGLYLLTGLRPAVYTIRAEAERFRVVEKKNIVLQVEQQTTIDFELHPLGAITTVEVISAPPLLDTENSSLGTMVSRLIIRQNAQAALLARPLKYFHKILQDLEIFRGVNGFLEAGFDGQVTLTRMALSEPPRGRLFAGGPGFFHRRVSARPDRVEIQHGAFAFGHAEVRGIRGLRKKSAGCMDVQFRLVILVTVTDVMHA